ncbi:magnesium transporter MgtE N-terminal domain-containing protein [Thiosocius teredinicola]|uniref:magnesium transporter MgtE N-terminal domain-containing protein n=1 Tax=Thiosocius teredinicola TaxID=1973002 RepID=UPI0013DE0F70
MLDVVTKGYLTLHPESAARTLARIDKRDAAEAFGAMPRQLAATVLAAMAPTSAARCLTLMPPPVAGEILARTPLPAAVSALRMCDEKQTHTVLKHLPRPKAARIRLRLRFSEWVIGAFVDDDVLTLSPQQRVGDALRLLRSSGHPAGQTIVVVDSHRRLIGIVDLCELLHQSDRRIVRHVMQPVAHVLNARAALQTVANHPAWMENDSLPVVNRNGIFQGVLRRSRVRQEETQLLNEIVERNELMTTRSALADIFWLAVGALFIGPGRSEERNAQDS